MPWPYAHIACCIDASRGGEQALSAAVAMWRAAGGRLSLVHVGPYPLLAEQPGGARRYRREDLNAAARDWLGRRSAEVPGAEPVFLQGVRGPVTCAWAEQAGVDLIVVGAGSGRLQGLIPGPFAHHLLESAPCSVMLVRPGASAGSTPTAHPATAASPRIRPV